MSYKSTNGIKLTKCDSQQWKTTPSLEASVKFAGEEAKDRLYEPKHKKKLVRVLTVVAYVFFVSLAAIMLSLYYVFLWNGDQKMTAKYVTEAREQRQYFSNKCSSMFSDIQQKITPEEPEDYAVSTIQTKTEDIVTFPSDYGTQEDFRESSTFMKRIMSNKYYTNY